MQSDLDLNCRQKMHKRAENTVEKGEIARYDVLKMLLHRTGKKNPKKQEDHDGPISLT